MLCFAWASAMGQSTNTTQTGHGTDRFKWSWEGDQPVRASTTSPAPSSVKTTAVDRQDVTDQYEKLVRENLDLRRKADEMTRLSDQSQKLNVEMTEKVKSLEQKEQALTASVKELRSRLESPDATRTSALSAELAKALSENSSLKERIGKLEKEGATSRSEPAGVRPSPPSASRDSDLFRRMESDNAELRRQMQALRESQRKETTSKETLTAQGERVSADVAVLRKQVTKLEEENRTLQATEKTVVAKTVRLVEVRMRDEMQRKDALLARKDKELSDLRGRLGKALTEPVVPATSDIDSSEKEKADLQFNMAVLYMRSGMYQDAEKEFLQLLKMNAGAADVHYNLGILYDKRLVNKRKAVSHYRKFLQLAPYSQDADKVRLWLVEAETDL